jgi:general secretion pathway protein C
VGGGQARLHQIHADRVILERDGGYETLRLPRPDGSSAGAPASAAPARAAAPAPTATATDEPRIQRSEWLGDPERLLQAVRARPVIQDGALYGLEVSPTRNARQFQQAGLRPGDVITSVNGMPLSAIDDADSLFQDLAGQLRVDLVVERDGQALPLSIQLID